VATDFSTIDVPSWEQNRTSPLANLGRSAPTVTNEHGGKGSDSPGRLDLIPASALMGIGARMKLGAEKYSETNWRACPVKEHLNHALHHQYAYLDMVLKGLPEVDGETPADHLRAAATRVLMALEVELSGGPDAKWAEKPAA
jgi:hypothetical protein